MTLDSLAQRLAVLINKRDEKYQQRRGLLPQDHEMFARALKNYDTTEDKLYELRQRYPVSTTRDYRTVPGFRPGSKQSVSGSRKLHASGGNKKQRPPASDVLANQTAIANALWTLLRTKSGD